MELEINDKQAQIMEKALELFASKGYDATSVRDIAQSADVNVAMISYYFGSKDKLLEAIFKKNTTELSAQIEAIIHDTQIMAMDKVDALIDLYINIIQKNFQFHNLLMREQIIIKDGVLFEYIRDMKRHNTTLIDMAVKAGQKKKIFQKNIDVPLLASTLIGSVNHFFSNYKYLCDKRTEMVSTDASPESEALVLKFRNHIKTMFKAYLVYGI
jgi:AcrR family transcriptional regulator